jgi:hypothetical protein
MTDATRPPAPRGPDRHYQTAIQPWDAMSAWMPPEQLEGFYRGNIIKYVSRYDKKGGLDDLRKARQYLDRLMNHLTRPPP